MIQREAVKACSSSLDTLRSSHSQFCHTGIMDDVWSLTFLHRFVARPFLDLPILKHFLYISLRRWNGIEKIGPSNLEHAVIIIIIILYYAN